MTDILMETLGASLRARLNATMASQQLYAGQTHQIGDVLAALCTRFRTAGAISAKQASLEDSDLLAVFFFCYGLKRGWDAAWQTGLDRSEKDLKDYRAGKMKLPDYVLSVYMRNPVLTSLPVNAERFHVTQAARS